MDRINVDGVQMETFSRVDEKANELGVDIPVYQNKEQIKSQFVYKFSVENTSFIYSLYCTTWVMFCVLLVIVTFLVKFTLVVLLVYGLAFIALTCACHHFFKRDEVNKLMADCEDAMSDASVEQYERMEIILKCSLTARRIAEMAYSEYGYIPNYIASKLIEYKCEFDKALITDDLKNKEKKVKQLVINSVMQRSGHTKI